MILGGIPAMYSAYRRGRVDTLLNTVSYAVLAFPALVAVIAIGEFWGHQLWKITVVIGVFSAPLIFRVVRASTLSYATRDFVMAAKALGASDRRILARELLPEYPADHRLVRADRGGHHHRAGGHPGLPGTVGATAHAELGQHAQRGRRPPLGREGPDQPVAGHLPGRRHVLAALRAQRGGRQAAGLLRRDRGQAVTRVTL